jgi:hypothetical protein
MIAFDKGQTKLMSTGMIASFGLVLFGRPQGAKNATINLFSAIIFRYSSEQYGGIHPQNTRVHTCVQINCFQGTRVHVTAQKGIVLNKPCIAADGGSPFPILRMEPRVLPESFSLGTFCKTISLGENSDESEDILNGIYGLHQETRKKLFGTCTSWYKLATAGKS